jgi:hypothetical protein
MIKERAATIRADFAGDLTQSGAGAAVLVTLPVTRAFHVLAEMKSYPVQTLDIRLRLRPI